MTSISRRNALLGLGTLVGGAGLISATGAFTAVEADRTVTVEAAGDGAALLALEPNSDYAGDADEYVNSPEDGVLSVTIENLNLQGRTRFTELLAVTNNGSQDVELQVQDYTQDDSLGLTNDGQDELGDPVLDFLAGGPSGDSILDDPVTVPVGDTVTLTVQVNLRGVTSTGDADDRFPEQVTFEANAI